MLRFIGDMYDNFPPMDDLAANMRAMNEDQPGEIFKPGFMGFVNLAGQIREAGRKEDIVTNEHVYLDGTKLKFTKAEVLNSYEATKKALANAPTMRHAPQPDPTVTPSPHHDPAGYNALKDEL